MLVKDYEHAKVLARDFTDEGLKAKRSRYDKVGFVTALVALASFVMLFGGVYLFPRFAPEFESSYPGLHMLLTVYLPAIGIAVFYISGHFLDRRRGIVDLALRLKQESKEKKGG